MDAFFFTLALFAFWGLVGLATIAVFRPRLRLIQGVLISPAIGIAVTILPVFFINRAGIPVKDFGGILLAALAVLAVLALVIKRPNFPVKRCLLYFGILTAALLLAAWPMFRYGFDWVSFSNDDMANYCLAAQRFLNHGFFDQPNLDDLYSGKDYSLAYWFMHVAGGSRSGSELMLSVVWAFSGLNAHQIFMPVIMALHLALLAGTGAMVSGVGADRKTPLIAMLLIALSPMTTLGALYQLIGQVGGLALLCAAVLLMYRPRSIKPISRLIIGNIPAVVVFSAIFVWYPEVLPFFGFGWMLFVFLLFIYSKQDVIKVVLSTMLVGGLTLITLNKYFLTALGFLLDQASDQGVQSTDISSSVFPYFLVPSGLAVLWGLIPITSDIKEPFLSLAIVVSLILIYWMIRRVILTQVRNITVPISMVLVMAGMGLLLFIINNDFGLFKLSMFVQPFLMGLIAIELADWAWKDTAHVKRIIFSMALLCSLLLIGITQLGYVAKSTGEFSSGLSEIPRSSSLKVNSQFKSIIGTLSKNKDSDIVIISETSNVVLAKFQALYSKGLVIFFPAKNFFDSSYMNERNKQFLTKQLEGNNFNQLRENSNRRQKFIYVYSSVRSDIFNSYQRPITIENDYFVIDSSPKNRLQFIHSALGNHYYLGDRKVIAFYQLENDPLFPGQQFASLGSHLLFEAINPTQNSRVVMELTDTVVKQFASELPKPAIQSSTLDFVGRGSGRIFSSPIKPTYIDDIPYISIDMRREGRQFLFSAKNMMLLYGRDVPMDSRLITAYGRDISMVSEEQYQALQPPASLKNFPVDLADKNLEYSGIYEDGWISERSFFILSAQPISKFLVVKGSVPQIENANFSSTLKISIDGKEVAVQKIGLGNFELKVPVTGLQGRQRVDINFTDYQQLPGADGRITGGKIDFIGFTEN
jgi:hypothetical protein